MGEALKTIRASRARVSQCVLLAALVSSVLSAGAQAGALSRGPTNAQRRALAEARVHQLFSSARLPVGSRRLTRWPPADGRALLATGGVSIDPDQFHQARFYIAPHGVAALAWVEGLSLRGGRRTSYGTGGGPGQPTTHFVGFTFASSGVLADAQLVYSMEVTASGDLGLRIDATVLWTPQKPRSAYVQAGASRIDVVVNRGYNVSSHRVSTTHVSNASLIRVITAHVNALDVATPGVRSCPFDAGATMTLSFFYAGHARPLAVVVVDPGGCGVVSITQSRAADSSSGVAHDAGGTALAAFVARALSIVNWNGLGSPVSG